MLLCVCRLILRWVSINFIASLNTIRDRIGAHALLRWEMTLASGNHVLVVMALPMGVILLWLMGLEWRSYDLLIVIIIHWSFDVVYRLHGVLVVIHVVTCACVDNIMLSRIKCVALILWCSLMLDLVLVLR